MLKCSDPCDECKPKAQKINCSISCHKQPKNGCQICGHEIQHNQCSCQKEEEVKCKLVCEKKEPECACGKEEKKISCKISCEKEEKPKRCEFCGRIIFSKHE